MELAVYFDFTCGYSYRAWLWLERMRADGAQLHLDWRPFVLKEVNRTDGEPSLLSGPRVTSVAVLALAAAEALRDTAVAELYRTKVFHAMHGGDERPSREEIIRIAAEAGLDRDAFGSEEALWLGRVRESHEGAVSKLGVFGTPTVVLDDTHSLYLKLEAVPQANDERLLNAVVALARDYPEVAELKRPTTSG